MFGTTTVSQIGGAASLDTSQRCSMKRSEAGQLWNASATVYNGVDAAAAQEPREAVRPLFSAVIVNRIKETMR